MHLLTICGSLQDGSANAALLGRFAGAMDADDVATPAVSPGDIPHFRPDLPDVDPAVHQFRSQIAAADAVLIATPEYAHSLPGSLKNALDWIVGSGELYEKPVAIVAAANGASRGGLGRGALEQTLRAQGSLIVDTRTVTPESTSDAVTEVLRLLRAATAAPA